MATWATQKVAALLDDLGVVIEQVVHGEPGGGWSIGEGVRPMDVVAV